MQCLYKPFICLLFSLFLISHSWAEDEEENAAPKVEYIAITPAIVTNYQAEHLHFLKADITLKVLGSKTADAVNRHLPIIRHSLVMLFNSKEKSALISNAGKQQLQQEALDQITAVLDEENEANELQGVLFTSFIVE